MKPKGLPSTFVPRYQDFFVFKNIVFFAAASTFFNHDFEYFLTDFVKMFQKSVEIRKGNRRNIGFGTKKIAPAALFS